MNKILKSTSIVLLLCLAACSKQPESMESDIASLTENSSQTAVQTEVQTPVELISLEEALSMEMPDVMEITEGGGDRSDFLEPCNIRLDSISGEFSYLVDEDEWEEYIAVNQSRFFSEETVCDISEYANLYSFVTHFDIPSDTVRELLAASNAIYISFIESGDFSNRQNEYYRSNIYTDEEIEAIATRDKEACIKLFASEYSIVNGEKIYSQNWLYKNGIEKYREVGISAEELLSKISQIETMGIGDKAVSAFENKIVAFAADEARNGNLTGTFDIPKFSNVEIPDDIKIFE